MQADVTQGEPRPGIVNLDPGYLDPELLPVELLGRWTRRALRRWGTQTLGYGADAGPLPLRAALAGRLAGCTPANVVTTAGTSAALDQLALLLAAQGRTLLTEASTYDLGRRIFEARGVPVRPVPGPVDDVDVDAFARAARSAARASGRAPAMYLIPTFHNPTGRVLPAERRRALVELAEREGMFVIEDQAYTDLSFGAPPPPPLWTYAEDRDRVVALYSFAKCLAPGLRAGWLVTGERLAAELAADPVRHSGGGPTHFTVMAVAAGCADGDLDRRIVTLRQQLRARRDALLGALDGALPPEFEVITPHGGFFAWVRLPPASDSAALRLRAEQCGVSYADGRRFGAEPGARLCFAAAGPDRLREGAARLIEAWRRG
ncbi:aminotransferase class I/II-fold pyridoxal phosphate-dependent enzyme [Actinoplanes sp. NPDC026623]|uniref:aminotransferase class I/II-fold pyridoxal phosphate-dependent enzyme n=1 Tax=Actinoplanes sp. NPDC026623 TaxID=3155610 RepID=UPI0033F6CF8C